MTLPARALIFLIRAYQYSFSAILGKQCRFHPTCSVYTADAIAHFGAWRGGVLGLKRIIRCHPWNKGGYDPVPPKSPR